MRLFLPALAAALLVASSPARAAEHSLVLAPADGRVTFLLGATGHDVEGSFPLQKCDVRFDPETGAASGEISLDASQGVTGNPKRDKTMREKVLLTGASPSIVFHPQHFQGVLPASGPGDVQLEGTCSIAGGDHPLTLSAHVERTGDTLHLVSTAPIPFVDWGLKDPSVMFLKVEKVVHLTIEGDAHLVAPAAAALPAAASGAASASR